MNSRKLGDYYPLLLELMLLFLIFYSFYYAIKFYPQLPDKIPAHFGIDGKPDGWVAKSWLTALGLSYFELALYLLMTIGTLVIIKSSNPLRFINLPIPYSRIEKLGEQQLEEIRKIVIQLMLVVKVVIVSMFAWLSCRSIQVAIGIREGLGYSMWVFIIILLSLIIWLTFRVYRVINKPDNRMIY